ncbi:MAG: DinB family protein [Bacteroidetes bacterium]|nr:DinB family protein [Bacteroidota bacterium]MBK8364537.1 DinB family protein [Bacteroidota bacterium]MBL0034001.1 DinB family protein [Bacteroidota bacterium]MBP6427875.1 DinB family protein [Bacteroidia bacterium]MBP6657320.1 DinB family protein [Bacteroidia bacterium]
MYRVLEDFLTDWKYESQSTLSLFKNLTDDSLTKVVHPDVRTLGFLAWHIVHTMQEMMAKVGLNVDIKDQENYSGENVKELCSAYENGANSLAEEIKKKWTVDDLQKEDNMYGEMWKRGTTLTILIKHEAHHRAEMIVLMRMLGLPVVGPYGPTREDWAKFGMPTMK